MPYCVTILPVSRALLLRELAYHVMPHCFAVLPLFLALPCRERVSCDEESLQLTFFRSLCFLQARERLVSV